MLKNCKAALAVAVAALCLCALPLAAQAGSWGGTVLSKGLVYDDVYGVVNGNAIMSKTVAENEYETVYEHDLVASNGTVLFKTGYVQSKGGGDFGVKGHEDFRYMPVGQIFNGRASGEGEFAREHGGMRAVDTTTGKVVVVNAKGKMVLSNCDNAAIFATDELVVGANLINGQIEFKLVDLNSGAVLHTVSGFAGATKVEYMIADPDSAKVEVRCGLSGNTYVSVANGRMELHNEPYPTIEFDNRIIYNRNGYIVRQHRDGNMFAKVTITHPSGEVKEVSGPFFSINVGDNDGENPTLWAFDEGGTYHYYTFAGNEIFANKGYGNVEKIANSDAYLCWLQTDTDRAYYIDKPGGTAKLLDTVEDSTGVVYDAYNDLIVKKAPETKHDYPVPMLAEVLDSTGRTLKTFNPDDCWLLESTKVWMEDGTLVQPLDTARWRLFQFTGYSQFNSPSQYLDANLNLVRKLDGRLALDTIQMVYGYLAFPLVTSDHDTMPHLPKTLYTGALDTVDVGDYTQVQVAYTPRHGNLVYVGDGKGHFGAVDGTTKKVAIPVQFDSIYDLDLNSAEDTILVQKDGKWYFMDLTGKKPAAPSFNDVSATTPHAEHITWLAATGISKGFPDGSFRPMANVVRQDMAAFIYRLCGEPEYTPSASDKARFPDVTEATPRAREIWWLASTGISTGYPDGTFRPMATVVRQDMAAFLHRIFTQFGDGSDKPATGSFPDVIANTPHAGDIRWLAANGISTGYPDGTFRPMANVVRQDMAAFLKRLHDLGV